MMGMLRTAQNPQAMLNQLISTTPGMKQVMDYVNQHGGDVSKALNTKMNELGITEQDLMDLMK